jgi:hypothetical protein
MQISEVGQRENKLWGEVSMCDPPLPPLIILQVVFWYTTLLTAQILQMITALN